MERIIYEMTQKGAKFGEVSTTKGEVVQLVKALREIKRRSMAEVEDLSD